MRPSKVAGTFSLLGSFLLEITGKSVESDRRS